jgi:predicted nucleic acid-binding protein
MVEPRFPTHTPRRIGLRLIVDSYAWIEFLSAGKRGAMVRENLESAESLLTPDIVLAEVARKYAREGTSPELVAGHLGAIVALSEIVEISIPVALRIAECDMDLRTRARQRKLEVPSFADSIVLGTAREFNARVMTGDKHFEGLPETVWVGP